MLELDEAPLSTMLLIDGIYPPYTLYINDKKIIYK